MMNCLLAVLVYAAVVGPAIAFGYWWRGRAKPVEVEAEQSSALDKVDSTDSVALIDIRLVDQVVQTDMRVDIPLLEKLANGVGKTLVDLPSRLRH